MHALAETAANLGDIAGVIHAAGVSPNDFLIDGGVTASYFCGELATTSACVPVPSLKT